MSSVDKGRRRLLAGTGQLAGAGWLAMNMPSLLAAAEAAAMQQSEGKGWGTITDSEAVTLAAVVDQIIPPDDVPGASQAGVVYFIDNVLGGIMSGMAGLVKQGIAELERAGFSGLSFREQTARLEAIEDTLFFGSMIFLTHCGMFSMPSWGGNLDRCGWEMLGFENLHAWQPPFGFYDAQLINGGQDEDHG